MTTEERFRQRISGFAYATKQQQPPPQQPMANQSINEEGEGDVILVADTDEINSEPQTPLLLKKPASIAIAISSSDGDQESAQHAVNGSKVGSKRRRLAVDEYLMSSPPPSKVQLRPASGKTSEDDTAAGRPSAPVIDCSSSDNDENDENDSDGKQSEAKPASDSNAAAAVAAAPVAIGGMSEQARVLAQRHILALSQLRLMFPNHDSPTLSKMLMENDNNINRVVELLLLKAPASLLTGHLQSARQKQQKRVRGSAPSSSSNVLKKGRGGRKGRRLTHGNDSDSEASVSSGGEDGDISDDDSDAASDGEYADSDEEWQQQDTIEFMNSADENQLRDMTNCTLEQVALILSLRPFSDYSDAQQRLKSTPGISAKVLENYRDLKHGFASLDSLLKNCESISDDLAERIKSWAAVEQLSAPADKAQQQKLSADSGSGGSGREDCRQESGGEETEMHFTEFAPAADNSAEHSFEGDYEIIRTQPETLEIQLKNYQLLGVNWLWLLHRKKLSGILADEMGLGKTAQVIAFIALLAEREDYHGPYLIVVPSSTSENWLREFEKFCPSIAVRPYYGNQQERSWLRSQLSEERDEIDVVVTTYNIAAGAKEDRSFLRKWGFQYLILDEGHMVKNVQSQRYQNLTSIKTPYRLLLTGTPLQNNLQELMALLMFIMPKLFTIEQESLDTIFSIRSNESDISKRRIENAKRLMSPFVLRRKKTQVLKDLPKKIEKVIMCEQTPQQQTLYQQLLSTSSKELVDNSDQPQQQSRLNNILMQLRKMACHPLLHRIHYTDDLLQKMSRKILKEEQYWDANPDYIFEDMQLLSDFQLHQLCVKNKSISRHALSVESLLDAGKTRVLCEQILPECKRRGDRVLLFSQFTMMLDVLEVVLQQQGYRYLRLDGQTPVAERQPLIDQFYADSEIFVFLLSTKAGGFGINLTPANYVIQHDLDFNPFNDCQAEDRAYRIGQTRDVNVLKLITQGTIEEQIYQRALRKLKLDSSLSGAGEATESAEVKTSGSKRSKTAGAADDSSAQPQLDAGTLMDMLKADLNEHKK